MSRRRDGIPLWMVLRRSVLVLAALAAVGGTAAYVLVRPLAILGVVGFFGLILPLLMLALGSSDKSWTRADDLRRADDHEEHPMPEGPAPPFQT